MIHEEVSPRERPFHCTLVRADLCDRAKCGRLWCAVFVSGGLRWRYPLIHTVYELKQTLFEFAWDVVMW